MTKATMATHTRLKTGEQVIVSREYNIVIVKSLRGKVLGSYDHLTMGKFRERYEPIKIKGR